MEDETTTMNITGLAEFLVMLKDGEALDDFDVLSVEQTGVNDDGETLYAVTITYGSLQYVVSSWMPAIGVRREIMRIAQQINEAHAPSSDHR